MKKKYFLLIFTMILTACFSKIDLQEKGSLSLSIKFPEAANNSNIQKTIKVGTETIIVSIQQSGYPETLQEKTIVYSSSNPYHIAEFKDLAIGNWSIKILCKDNTSSIISSYYDTVFVNADAPTIIHTMFGAPNKIYSPYYDGIQNGAVLTGQSYLKVVNPGNSYMDIGITNSAIFFVSDKSDFSTNITGSPYNYGDMLPYENSVSIGPINSDIIIENNKNYYWRVMVFNEFGFRYSNVFTFSTELVP